MPHGFLGDVQALSYRLVPSAFTDESNNLQLSRSEAVDLYYIRISFLQILFAFLKFRHRARHHRPIQPGFTRIDFSNRLHKKPGCLELNHDADRSKAYRSEVELAIEYTSQYEDTSVRGNLHQFGE